MKLVADREALVDHYLKNAEYELNRAVKSNNRAVVAAMHNVLGPLTIALGQLWGTSMENGELIADYERLEQLYQILDGALTKVNEHHMAQQEEMTPYGSDKY